jgi:16S rRNA G966 N2-methylase RsmD
MEEIILFRGGKITAEKIKIAKTVYDISPEQRDQDYEKFMALSCGEATPFSNIGLKFLNYYFAPYRLDTLSKKNISYYEFYNDKEIQKKPYIQSLLKRDVTLYEIFKLYFGSIAQFRPTIAYELYCKLKPTSVLDFSAGWGGRCLAAIKYDCQYVGFDTNTDLKKPYNQMLSYIKPKTKTQIIFQDSATVDFSKYKYDMVFTSPPYFTIEKYENMPSYSSYQNWIETFLQPVISKSYRYMQTNGNYCVNVPKAIYDDIKKILRRPADLKIPLKIRQRQEGVIKYREYIYVWKK